MLYYNLIYFMKTTNKILLIMFILILAGITISLIYVRIQFGNIDETLGSGIVTTEQRQLNEFDGLRVSGNFNVAIHVDHSNMLVIETDDDLMEFVNTAITDNTLVVDFLLRPAIHKTIDINLYVNEISSIEVLAGAWVSSEDTLNTVFFRHILGSGANSNLLIHVDSLHLESSSGSLSTLKGSARTIITEVSSGAQVRATELTAEFVDVQASSGANVHVNAQKELTANASSGSNIGYTGSPATQNFSTSGGGSVKPI